MDSAAARCYRIALARVFSPSCSQRSTQMKLSIYQAKILSFLFESLPTTDEVDYLEFSLSGSFSGKYRVVHSEIRDVDTPSRIVFNLPTYSQSVFLALTKTNPSETALILANLEDYERETSKALRPGETVVLPNELSSIACAPYGLVLLRAATSVDCEAIPDNKDFDERRTSFSLVVPLTKDESEIRNQLGHDALMDEFERSQKQLFF